MFVTVCMFLCVCRVPSILFLYVPIFGCDSFFLVVCFFLSCVSTFLCYSVRNRLSVHKNNKGAEKTAIHFDEFQVNRPKKMNEIIEMWPA